MFRTFTRFIRHACLLFSLLTLAARGMSQQITLSGEDMPLQKVFRAIEKQTKYTFFYKPALLKNSSRVSVNFQNLPLAEALEKLFANQPIIFSFVGKMITLEKKPEKKTEEPGGVKKTSLNTGVIFPSIGGTVFDEAGKTLQGVTVTVTGTNKATMTDAKGNFKLKDVDIEATLSFTCVGYNRKLLPLNRESLLMVVLQPAVTLLDQAVVQAYGTTTRRLATGNITRISGAEISKQPVMNPLLALQGRVPGLIVTPSNGFASSKPVIQIRGINNLSMITDPLYIVDNVPMPENMTPLSRAFITSGELSPIFNIQPKDIESIEILKDADATAIYGSRGANGVILITTKKGKPGPTRFSLNISQGITSIPRYWKYLSTPEYLQMRREALNHDGITPDISNAPDLLRWDTTRYTDWQKVLWGRTGRTTDVNVSITGGEQLNTFGISASYNRVTDITAVSGATQRATFRFSFQHRSEDQKFSASLTSAFTYGDVNVISGGGAPSLAPNAPPIFDKNGKPNYAEWNVDGLLDIYPFASYFVSSPQKNNNLNTSLTLGYNPVKGLSFNTSLGTSLNTGNTSMFTPIAAQNPYKITTGSASFNSSKSSVVIIEPQATYQNVFGKNSLNLLIGGSWQYSNSRGSLQEGNGYTDDNLLHSINNAPSIIYRDSYEEYKYAGLFGRISYNYDNKYVINLNGRRDGSSRFAPGRQFGNFGSIGAAWIASEEKWLKDKLPGAISFVKLRGSYGITGSDAVGDYQYLSLWSAAGLPRYGEQQPYVPFNPPDQDYHWQTNRKTEIALDLGLLKDNQINLSFALYRNRTSNQISSDPLGLYTGFATVLTNMPATIENKGWEISLNARLISRQDISWTVNFNISGNRNKLVSFPDLANSAYVNMFTVGQSLSTLYVLHYTGINPLTGEYSYEDYNKDGKVVNGGIPFITPDTDRRFMLDPAPKYTGGFGTQFSYKKLSVSLFFDYTRQLGRNAYGGLIPDKLNSNKPQEVFNNRWKYPGDKALYPGLTTLFRTSVSYFPNSDAAFSDASYLRLNNLSLQYSLPDKWLSKMHMKNCNLFINTQNVFVITRYKGIDPQTQNINAMPPARVLTGGLNFTF